MEWCLRLVSKWDNVSIRLLGASLPLISTIRGTVMGNSGVRVRKSESHQPRAKQAKLTYLHWQFCNAIMIVA
eukprot:scaffold168621_cov34-Attheya_sp.AAC.1